MKALSDSEPLRYGRAESPFGPCWIGLYGGRLARLVFAPDAPGGTVSPARLLDWPDRPLVAAPGPVARLADQIFRLDPEGLAGLDLWLEGSDFQRKVWAALRRVPRGSTLSYVELARRIGAPGAARAVGAAVGANPIAYVVPCHRVLRADGSIGGFRWGIDLKRRLLAAEGVWPG